MADSGDLRAEATVYADMLTVKVVGHEQRGGGRRGAVTTFTDGSRRRMLQKLAMIRQTYQRAFFMTLTYPMAWSPEPRVWKRDLDTFVKRVRRRWPRACGIWRIEFQERGAPHFHLIIWNIGPGVKRTRRRISRMWYEVVGSGDEKHYKAGTEVSHVKNRRKAGWYVSKYSAKVASTPVDPETGEVVNVGRWWGTFGDLRLGHVLRIVLSLPEAHALRRLARGLLRSRANSYAVRLAHLDPSRGFTVYALGDKSCPEWSDIFDSTAFAMLQSVIRAA